MPSFVATALLGNNGNAVTLKKLSLKSSKVPKTCARIKPPEFEHEIPEAFISAR